MNGFIIFISIMLFLLRNEYLIDLKDMFAIPTTIFIQLIALGLTNFTIIKKCLGKKCFAGMWPFLFL